ncbi:MAG TPA: hypothetical protein VFW65_32295 [Pseudonocardiaceae bacterium]|nr:hypothetical protein [Pseudonocardiaceae bacterium]
MNDFRASTRRISTVDTRLADLRCAEVDRWTLDKLPLWNESLLAGASTIAEFVTELVSGPLRLLPDPRNVSLRYAQQMIVDVGVIGASVGRHRQEHDRALLNDPERSFDGVLVGPAGTPFLDYFSDLAEASGTGHPARDALVSLVRWNVPGVTVRWEGERLESVPSVFDDGLIRAYMGKPAEGFLFTLLKKSEAVELAANRILEPLAAGDILMTSDEARERMRAASGLLYVLHQMNLDFVAHSDGVGFVPDFFIDVLRQFAIHWRPDDIPPSGAEDVEFLKRDFLLGMNFPHYDRHVRRIFPALLDEDRESLRATADLPSLPGQLLAELGIAAADLTAMSESDLTAVVRREPAVSVLYFLLQVNAQVAASHLMLTKKYLFKPTSQRDEADRVEAAIVSNYAGTTGMLEKLLENLAAARRDHLLQNLRQVPRDLLKESTGMPPFIRVSQDEISTVVQCG